MSNKDRIKELETRVNDLELDIFKIKNPAKYKILDKVVFIVRTGDPFDSVEDAMKERGTIIDVMVVQGYGWGLGDNIKMKNMWKYKILFQDTGGKIDRIECDIVGLAEE